MVSSVMSCLEAAHKDCFKGWLILPPCKPGVISRELVVVTHLPTSQKFPKPGSRIGIFSAQLESPQAPSEGIL